MRKEESEYLRFIDKALELCKDIPRYFSKFSNKVYCNHQKIVLLVLKQKLRTTYRDLVELLKVSSIPLYIGLKKIPHHTTLVKFAKKIKPRLLDLLLPYRKSTIAGLDGTGFEVENRSMHYKIRTGIKSYRRYIKLCVSSDLEKQIILKQEIHKGPRHDNKDFLPIIDGIQAKYVCADKGYDSFRNHMVIMKTLKAKSLIKIKEYSVNKRIPRAGRKYREKAIREFDETLYHQRSKVESIFSSIKRKYGSCLKARTFYAQKKEVILKLIAYNIDRMVNFYLLFIRISAEPVYQSHKISYNQNVRDCGV